MRIRTRRPCSGVVVQLPLSYVGATSAQLAQAQFDVAADGQRLLVLETRSGGERIVLVQNFIEELRARLAAASPRAR